MKYLILSNLWGIYAVGGAEQVALAEARSLMSAGHEVVVLTASPGTLRPQMTIEEGIRVWRFFPLNLFFYADLGKHSVLVRLLWHVIDLFSLNSFFTTQCILAQEKPDHIISHNLKGLGMMTAFALRRSGIPHTHVVHDVQLITPSGLLWWGREDEQESLMTSLYRIVLKIWFGSPQTVRFLSDWCRQIHDRYGFFPHSNKEVHQTRVTSRPYFYQTGKILFVGQIELHKGIALLVDVMTSFPTLTLHVYGTGTALQALQSRTCTNIIWHGKVTSDILDQAYQSSDAVVIPSLVHENSPRVIVEAGIYNTPIIASRVGGIPEMVDTHAVLFDPTVEGLSSALRQ